MTAKSRTSHDGALMDLNSLRLIGWAYWNPIGLEGLPATPADEYDHYLMQAAGMISRGQTDAEIVDYLVRSVEVDMCLRPADRDAARNTVVAIKTLVNTQ